MTPSTGISLGLSRAVPSTVWSEMRGALLTCTDGTCGGSWRLLRKRISQMSPRRSGRCHLEAPNAVGAAVRRPDSARCAHRGDHPLSGRRGTGVDREDRAPPQARAGSRGGLLRPGSVPVQQLRQRRAAGISGGPADPDRQTAASAGRPRPAPAHRFGPHQSPPPDATAGHSTCPDSGIPHPHSPQRVRQQADGPSRKVEVNGPLTEPLRAGTEPLPDVIGFSVPHDATAI